MSNPEQLSDDQVDPKGDLNGLGGHGLGCHLFFAQTDVLESLPSPLVDSVTRLPSFVSRSVPHLTGRAIIPAGDDTTSSCPPPGPTHPTAGAPTRLLNLIWSRGSEVF